MKYIRLRAWLTILVIIVGVIVMLHYSTSRSGPFKSSEPITDSSLTSTYPELYQAVTERDVEQLKSFLSDDDPEIRTQAWRAFATTPVDSESVADFLTLANEQNSEAAWFGISQQELTEEQVRNLEKRWLEADSTRAGIARVLGHQGDEQTLNFLLDHRDEINPQNEYHFALAIGRLTEQFEVDNQQQIQIIQKAFNTRNYDATKAYLYGWYRGDESRLSSTAQDSLFGRWDLMGAGLSRDVDQYVNKILPERTTYKQTIFYNGEQLLNKKIQLAYELAKSVEHISLSNQNALAAKILLTNENPHVQIRTLESIEGRLQKGEDPYGYIRDEMLAESKLADAVWVKALKAMLTVDADLFADHENRLEAVPEQNPYLWPDVLEVYEEVESPADYLNRIEELVAKEDTLPAMYAVQRLNNFVEGTDDLEEDHVQQIRDIVFDVLELGDRGTSYMAAGVLEQEELFSEDDFEQINQSLSVFSLPDDIEVYQAFGSLYKQRFESQAEEVIDSLASLDHAPLNRSLASDGWDVEVPEERNTEFRLPDWDRLWELGRTPTMRIRTNKGLIDIELQTLSAPSTVAMLDSLSRADAYEGVPFHRVVPNFVVQGGDIERQDGFGGPDFVIPTETSEKEFERSAVGIASAGPDTEGSQYFIMHQWMPHLNGNYTRFGEVTRGMKIVDKITVGDRVISVSWR
ncbi:MAG: peptidylprolyl isomerase [Bacteroidota bacterium]